MNHYFFHGLYSGAATGRNIKNNPAENIGEWRIKTDPSLSKSASGIGLRAIFSHESQMYGFDGYGFVKDMDYKSGGNYITEPDDYIAEIESSNPGQGEKIFMQDLAKILKTRARINGTDGTRDLESTYAFASIDDAKEIAKMLRNSSGGNNENASKIDRMINAAYTRKNAGAKDLSSPMYFASNGSASVHQLPSRRYHEEMPSYIPPAYAPVMKDSILPRKREVEA